MIDTPYGKIKSDIFQQAKNIKLFVCDVDGVFSDGRIYLGNDGEELKAFHTKDGFGLKAIMPHEDIYSHPLLYNVIAR